ncbi:hypothetical protein J2X04_000888 [Lysobacter niabensis]|uniref:Uncharacterized protein n=1 Tax=Agrilutibacter niabensis TaxID=380628 RepID=A0ABU1VM41_9GAMM|nr:hypothetical protein [Lysobacter niabensis]MDR7098541.1 hypothetical protein [Lysobacter niabensis]
MKFTFEGEQLTISEIRKRVPILANNTIRSHFECGPQHADLHALL